MGLKLLPRKETKSLLKIIKDMLMVIPEDET